VSDVPAKTFAREFLVALGNQVTWKREGAARRSRCSRSPLGFASQSQAGGHIPECEKELADLRTRSAWAVPGTTATNADLLSLAEEFPAIEINRLRRMLVDNFAELGVVKESGSMMSGGAGRTFRIPVSITEAMDMVRRGLLLELYGPATSQIVGPVASDDGGEIGGRWLAVSQAWRDAVLLELPALNKNDIRLAFADITLEICAGGNGVTAGPSSGLTWRRYGRGLQADAEAALKARLVALAEQKAIQKRAAEEAMRKREAERAKKGQPGARTPF
jgi:hypothetical protein